LLNTAGQRCAASRSGGADGLLQPDLALDISVLDHEGAWIHGQPLRGDLAVGDLAHQDFYVDNRSSPQQQWGVRGPRAAGKLPVRVDDTIRHADLVAGIRGSDPDQQVILGCDEEGKIALPLTAPLAAHEHVDVLAIVWQGAGNARRDACRHVLRGDTRRIDDNISLRL